MANYEIIIPENAQVPAYALLDTNASTANQDALFGGSAGAPPRIKASGKAFTLINEAGEETPYPPGKLMKGPYDNLYLPVIVLGVKPSLTKTFYLNPYNPNDEEHGAPDCMSLDGVKPVADCFAPQSDICATCPQNMFGSGTDQNGNPTKGKACTDNGVLAVFVPEFGVHQLKIMPKSLKPWRQFVTELTKRNYRVNAVITLVGFDLSSEYAIYQFQFGGFVPEKTLPKLAELAASSEVDAIVNPIGAVSAAPKAIAAPVQQQVEAKPDPAPPENPAPKQTRQRKAPEPKPQVQTQSVAPEMDLGLDDPIPNATSAGGAAPSDDDLAAALGL